MELKVQKSNDLNKYCKYTNKETISNENLNNNGKKFSSRNLTQQERIMTSKRRKMNDLNQRIGNLNGSRATVSTSSSSSAINNRHSAHLHTSTTTHTNNHPHITASANANNATTTTNTSTTTTTTTNTSSQSPKLIRSAITFLEHEEENLVYQENEQLVKTHHSNNLLKKLNSMRDDENLCDYEIRINGKSFHVHKCLLIATSDFFKAMLTGTMKESRENFVDLKGFYSPSGIKLILDFIYTGLLQISFDNILSILDAASHLQINEALKLSADFLVKNLNILNCVQILKLADIYSLKSVIEFTQQYLSENIVEIYQNGGDQFNQLSYEQLKYLLNNEYLQICSELDLFLMIVKWIEAGEKQSSNTNNESNSSVSCNSSKQCKNSRLKYAPDLMKSIRFMCMSAEELADYVEKVEFMRTIAECSSFLMAAYRWHALPKRQPLVKSEQTKLRNQEMLVAVGETNIYVLNEIKQKWEIVCSAPLEENYPYPFSVITMNNYLYVLGTRRSTTEEYRTCYRFSPRTLEWTQLAPLLHDRSRFGAAIISNHIYIFGGFEGFKRSNRVYLNTIERYSIEEDRWEEFSTDGPIMSCVASCSFENIIYFGGGKNMNWSKVSDFYSINVATKTITKKANMLTARTTHQIAVVNRVIYVLGGFDDAGNGILSIESYDIKSDQWSVVTSVPGTISKTWPQSLGVLNGRLYISVFTTPNTFKIVQKGFYYDINSNIWSEAPIINERARYCPTCCLAFPRKVYNLSDSCLTINHESGAGGNYRTNPSLNAIGAGDYFASLDLLNEFNRSLNASDNDSTAKDDNENSSEAPSENSNDEPTSLEQIQSLDDSSQL